MIKNHPISPSIKKIGQMVAADKSGIKQQQIKKNIRLHFTSGKK